MKKGWMIALILIAIIGIVVLQWRYTASNVRGAVQMEGHQVKELLGEYYNLNNNDLENVENTLSQLDLMVKESLNEAIASKVVSQGAAQKRMTHMQRVSFFALELMKAYEEAEGISFTKQQAEELMIVAYLHDIRKYADGNHAKQGAKYVLENLPNYINVDELSLERISGLIKYHSDPLSEKQIAKLGEDAILAQLLQDADTADKIINRGEGDEEIAKLNLSSSVNLVASYQDK